MNNLLIYYYISKQNVNVISSFLLQVYYWTQSTCMILIYYSVFSTQKLVFSNIRSAIFPIRIKQMHSWIHLDFWRESYTTRKSNCRKSELAGDSKLMKHHPLRLGLRQATKPESLLRGSARDEETRRLFLVEQTLEWVACASHIFIDFISLWLLCHAGPGVRIHTRARREEKRKERERGREREREERERKNKDERKHNRKKRRDTGWDIPRWPRNGTVTSGCGTSVDTSFHFTSPLREYYIVRGFAHLFDYVGSTLYTFPRSSTFPRKYKFKWKKKRLTNKYKI